MANRPDRKGRRVIETEPGQQGQARPNLSILAPGPSSSVEPSGYNTPSTPQNQQSTQPPVLTAQSAAQNTYQMLPLLTSTQPKIAIPRLKTASHTDMSLAIEKHRVSHACESCRRRKVKCTGEQPRCKHCTDFDLPCTYADGKRDRLKREYTKVKTTNSELLDFVKSMSSRVGQTISAVDQCEMLRLMDSAADDISIAASSVAEPSPQKRTRSGSYSVPLHRSEGGDHGEDEVGAEVGSNESLDLLEEDLNKDPKTRATGFIGKNSDVQWFRRLKQQAEQDSDEDARASSPYGPPGTSDAAASARVQSKRKRRNSHQGGEKDNTSAATYHLDFDSVYVKDYVDAWELPPVDTARDLFESYWRTVHDGFPIVAKDRMQRELDRTYNTARRARLDPKVQGLLNLIFAIGAHHAHLIRQPLGDERDHIIYYTRGRMIGLNSDVLVDHPDIQQVQTCALLGFYYTSISQMSRAWILTGLAIRYAFTLGLHVRNEDPGITSVDRELRVRVWWSVYALERLLCVVTGRPTSIIDDHCSTPLPVAMDDTMMMSEEGPRLIDEWNHSTTPGEGESSVGSGLSRRASTSSANLQPAPNAGLYFRLRMQLGTIVHRALIELYSAGSVMKSWETMQGNVTDLLDRLEKWLHTLPLGFDFTKDSRSKRFLRERVALGLFYQSAKIVITRPCLCRLERRIEHQTGSSKTFNQEKAQACVHAAREMMNLLPDEANAVQLYSIGPWWCQVHLLMQASAVSLLELAYGSCHMPDEVDEITATVKKVIRWLRQMAEVSFTAKRAWEMSLDLLQKVAARSDINVDISEIDIVAPSPARAPGGVPEPPPLPNTPTRRRSSDGPLAAGERTPSAQMPPAPSSTRMPGGGLMYAWQNLPPPFDLQQQAAPPAPMQVPTITQSHIPQSPAFRQRHQARPPQQPQQYQPLTPTLPFSSMSQPEAFSQPYFNDPGGALLNQTFTPSDEFSPFNRISAPTLSTAVFDSVPFDQMESEDRHGDDDDAPLTIQGFYNIGWSGSDFPFSGP